MLVPFELNEEKIKELNIPRHIADWHRIRILKEIDDIRYQAMIYANMDLTGDSMLALKKLKLFTLFNPVIDTENNKITKYDPIVEAYDIPLDWYFKTAFDWLNFAKRNDVKYSYYYRSESTAIADILKNDSLRVVSNVQGTKCFFFFLNPPSDPSIYNVEKDAVISCFDFIRYNGNFNFDNENSDSFWNFKPYLSEGRDCVEMYMSSDFLAIERDINGKRRGINTDIPGHTVGLFHFKYYYTRTADDDYSHKTSIRNVNNYYFFDPNSATIPEILKLELVLGYISSNIMHYAPLSDTLDILMMATHTSIADRNIPVVANEPNRNYEPTSSQSNLYYLGSYDGKRYTLSVPNKDETYPKYYKSINITLANGKSYYLPSEPFKYPDPFQANHMTGGQGVGNFNYDYLKSYNEESELRKIKSFKINDRLFNRYKLFADKNTVLQNFPRYYPSLLLFNDNRIRNGILYSDASKFYQLELIKYPDATLDKIDSLIFQQESIQELWKDISNGFYYYKKEYDSNNKVVYNWYYYEFGLDMPFLHPVTQKPVSAVKFFYEMVFEMIVLWGEIQKEIDLFLRQRKIQNEAAYNMAYQNFLRGAATMKGPEALALFEEKLRTGIFYIENGIEYWRKFTTLEITLIEKFKSNAYKNADIEKQNIEIRKLNERYQYEANLPILTANEKILTEARLMALPELKKIADEQLSKIVPPTIDYLINRAESEGGFPTDMLNKWVQENPYYYIRPDLRATVEKLLQELTLREQQVATALAAEAISEVKFTKALQDIFEIKG